MSRACGRAPGRFPDARRRKRRGAPLVPMSGLARQADGVRPLASRRGEPALRIEGRLARSQLEVQIGAFERTGVADRAHDFAGTHYVVLRSRKRGEVRHEGEVPGPMIDDEEVAVPAE